jgi:hypothetical protein
MSKSHQTKAEANFAAMFTPVVWPTLNEVTDPSRIVSYRWFMASICNLFEMTVEDIPNWVIDTLFCYNGEVFFEDGTPFKASDVNMLEPFFEIDWRQWLSDFISQDIQNLALVSSHLHASRLKVLFFAIRIQLTDGKVLGELLRTSDDISVIDYQ